MIMDLKKLSCTSLIVWAVLAVVALYFLYPPRKRIKLGIDLAGGTYITLGVKVEKAVENQLQGIMNSLNRQLKREGKLPLSSTVDQSGLVMKFESEQQAEDARKEVEQDNDVVATVQGQELRVNLSADQVKEIEHSAVSKTVDVLRTRLNSMGVEEVAVLQHGANSIVVELPDVQDSARARKLIGTPSVLEFKLVEYVDDRPAMASSKEELLNMFDGQLPEGTSIYQGSQRSDKQYYVLQNYAEVTGQNLKEASPIVESSRGRPEWAISFKLNADGGARFAELTRQNIGKLLAIVIDGKVISAPSINAEISTSGVITGNYSAEAARDEAFMLKSGAFVAPVTFEEERHVGPGLGADSISSGFMACLFGLLLLFIFSVYYYKFSGLLAFVALLYNLLLVLLILSWFKAALTLPGIAGLALTVGMAIDCSILIFERTKELLRAGEPIRKAVKAGFSGARAVILDANATHFIVGVVMFYFGTGPVRGFAITLMVGILSTLVTGLFFLRAMFDCWLSRDIKKLSI